MGWIPVNWHDLLLERIANSKMQVVLTELPNSYKEAYWPKAEWKRNTAYGVGDLVTAPLPGGYRDQVLQSVFFIYECTHAGTSGNNEPTFPTQAGDQLTEGGVTWTTHRNTVLAICKTGLMGIVTHFKITFRINDNHWLFISTVFRISFLKQGYFYH